MAFWGVEIKPGKPCVHRYDDENGRLHVSQATLGTGSSTKKSIVECKVGDKTPIYLCSLLPERIETCALNLEFEEDDEVIFSVAGPHSVHLSGFFYPDNDDQDNGGDDYGSDLYGGNIVGSDSEDEDDSMDYDSFDDGEDDHLTEDDLGMFRTSAIPNSGVRIEEIVDDKEITNETGLSKQGRKKKNKSDSDISGDHGNSNNQIVVKAGKGVPVLESEDEDGFPISVRESVSDFSNSASKSGKISNRVEEETNKKKEKVAHGKKSKRKIDSLGQDGEPERDRNEPCGSSVQPDTLVPENGVVKNKKKKKVSEKEESIKESEFPNSSGVKNLQRGEIGNDLGPTDNKRTEKKKKKRSEQGEDAVTLKAEETPSKGKGSSAEKEEKEEVKPSQVRTFPNGLVIEEVAMGKPDGKRASPGKKVSVHYIGKLKNGKIFDSNIGRAPFKFRLGIGQVIKGWDVGVNGMRIGDKRRLTIPPGMGYGAKGCPPTIPPNSWLVFDVELEGVN